MKMTVSVFVFAGFLLSAPVLADSSSVIETCMKELGYQVNCVTFAGPMTSSKPHSQEIDEQAHVWLCVKQSNKSKVTITKISAIDGNSIEIQMPLAERNDALYIAERLSSNLLSATSMVLQSQERLVEPRVVDGFSVMISTNCDSVVGNEALLIRQSTGSHQFVPGTFGISKMLLFMSYKIPPAEKSDF